MKLKSTTKFALLICSVLVLAVASSSTAMISSWQNERHWLDVVHNHFASVKNAQLLQIALLEQRGYVANYILDGGDPHWLHEMARREPQFIQRLQDVHDTAHTQAERQVLEELGAVFVEYDRQRDATIELYNQGESEAARKKLLDQNQALYKRATLLCDEFLQTNEEYVDAAILQSRQQFDRMALVSGSLVAITFVLGGLLATLLFRNILFPLRRLVAEVQDFSGDQVSPPPEAESDELVVVGRHLRLLMNDVTDTRSTLHRSQRLLIDADKLVSVGKLASSVAHEIRNPLTAIKMWLYSVRKSVSADAEVSRKLNLIVEEIAHLESIVRNFLEFSRPPSLQSKPTQVETQVAKALELLVPRLREKSIRVRQGADRPQLVAAAADKCLISEPDIAAALAQQKWPAVLGDGEQLKQVFVNLLLNAVDATGPGGEITISAETTTWNDRQWLVVQIEDSGCGVPEEVQARIFEPFFTTKEEGTGLGLCIAAQIMVQHDGRLILESSSEEGTRFAAWLPCEAAR